MFAFCRTTTQCHDLCANTPPASLARNCVSVCSRQRGSTKWTPLHFVHKHHHLRCVGSRAASAWSAHSHASWCFSCSIFSLSFISRFVAQVSFDYFSLCRGSCCINHAAEFSFSSAMKLFMLHRSSLAHTCKLEPDQNPARSRGDLFRRFSFCVCYSRVSFLLVTIRWEKTPDRRPNQDQTTTFCVFKLEHCFCWFEANYRRNAAKLRFLDCGTWNF